MAVLRAGIDGASMDRVLVFFGGLQFVNVHLLMRLLRRRESVANVRAFVKKQVRHCLVATWWTNAFYMVLWLVCEGVCGIRNGYS